MWWCAIFPVKLTIDTTGIAETISDWKRDEVLLNLDGRLDSMNIYGPGSSVKKWSDYPLQVKLDAPSVSTLELGRFIPGLRFLGDHPSLS